MAPDADLLEFYQKQLAVPLHTVMHTFCKSKDAPSQHDASIHQHDQNRVYIYDYIYNIIITYIYTIYICTNPFGIAVDTFRRLRHGLTPLLLDMRSLHGVGLCISQDTERLGPA